MKRNFFKIIILSLTMISTGCSNISESYKNINDGYNRKNKTANRSIIADTIIATTLYNNPEIISKLTIGKSRTKTKSKTNVNSISNTVTNRQNFVNGSETQSITTTKYQSRTKTKSTTRGISISPNLDYYLK